MIVREDRERVRFLGLERAPSNVLNVELLAAIRREALEAEKDPAVRAVVFHSRLPRYFSTGIDLAELTSLPPERQGEPFEELYRRRAFDPWRGEVDRIGERHELLEDPPYVLVVHDPDDE